MSVGAQQAMDFWSDLPEQELHEEHPYLPDDWSGSVAGARMQGGPWECDSCETGLSLLLYRCSICGNDLAGGGQS